jgi:signal transduction histidine kinase
VLVPQPLDPAVVTHEAVTAFRPQLTRKRLGLKLDVPERLPPIEADPARLEQILRSLLSNAVKFTPEDGVITVRAAAQPRGGVAIEIADTGIGIAAEALPVVLLPFTQLGPGCRQEPRGAGLGLPLAKALVELHGGALTICSRPGCGTRVEVGLPARVRAPSYDPAI